MASLEKNAFTVSVVFSLWINVIILQGCWKKSFAEEPLATQILLLFVFFFFFFWLEINHLLLCVWFPGSWLELPRQTLNTAPLFSPQEQCLNVESTPILTEDAQSWIWVEVGISDALRRGTRRPHMACSPPASFKEALGPWEGSICLSWWSWVWDDQVVGWWVCGVQSY